MFDSVVGWSDPPIGAGVYRTSRSSGSVLKPVSGLYLVDYRAERAVAAHRCDSVAGHVLGDTVSDPRSVFVLSVDAVAFQVCGVIRDNDPPCMHIGHLRM
jgi:hypothetical protein